MCMPFGTISNKYQPLGKILTGNPPPFSNIHPRYGRWGILLIGAQECQFRRMSISHQGFCGYYEILVSSPAIVVIVSHLLYCSNSDLYCLRPSTLVKCTLTTCFNLHIPHLALYICLSLCFLFFMAFLLPALLSIVKVLSSCST